MPHAAPNQDVFLNVFGTLALVQFSWVFERWAELVSPCMSASGKHIAIDGKSGRRSTDSAHDRLRSTPWARKCAVPGSSWDGADGQEIERNYDYS